MQSFKIETPPNRLMEKAKTLTGIKHIADTFIEEPLERLLQSLNTEAELSKQGALAMEDRLLRLLANRLRMLRDLEQHPEIDERPIKQPVFLTGFGRTGSTKLHKMLAASGDFIYLPFWQGYSLPLHSGNRDETPNGRIADARAHTAWFDTHAPMAKLIHGYEAFEPEEETLIMEHMLSGAYLMAFVFIPSYVQWWSSVDFRMQLKFIKQGLQYLDWQLYPFDDRPRVLKCPIYHGVEDLIAEVFPGASFLVTHREPVKTIPSSASLLHHYHKAYSDADRKQILGPLSMEGQAAANRKHMDIRNQSSGLKAFDVAYGKLMNESETLLRDIYAHIDKPLDERSIAAVKEWERQNQQHKHGAHKPTLEEFALSREMIEESSKDYIARFKDYF